MNKMLKTINFILLLLWQLPQSFIGWLMLLWFIIIDDVKFIKYHKNAFIFTSNKMRGSISLGTIIILCKNHSNSNSIIQHELGHVLQSQRIGWLYLFFIGLPSICWAAIHTSKSEKSYYSFYTEKWANLLGKVQDYKYGSSFRLKIIENILWE